MIINRGTFIYANKIGYFQICCEAHWISVILQRTEANEVYHLIAQSYDLTKNKGRFRHCPLLFSRPDEI